MNELLIEVNGMGLGEASERFVKLAMAAGYGVVASGPNRFRLARTYRPKWATILATCTAIFLLFGLLFLLVKRTETGDVVIAEERTGVKLRVTGTLDAGLVDALRTELGGGQGAAPLAPPPTTFQPAAVVTPVPPMPAPNAVQPILVFADGRSIVVGAGGVIGRDPTAVSHMPGSQLCRVDDPSLSKTHMTFGPLPHGVWVVDDHSTNGTVIEVGGVPQRCEPGIRTEVPFGAQVVAGDCRISVGAQ